MNVLLSIKPEYVKKIREGYKKYEFRRSIFGKKRIVHIKNVYIYSSSPIKKIVARFIIDEIIEDHPEVLWERFKDLSGVKKRDFFNYFQNVDRGFAIKIKRIKFFNEPIDPYSIFPDFVPPQSFRYFKEINLINKKIEDFIFDSN